MRLAAWLQHSERLIRIIHPGVVQGAELAVLGEHEALPSGGPVCDLWPDPPPPPVASDRSSAPGEQLPLQISS